MTLSLFGAESSWFVGVGIGVFIVLSCLVLAYVREFAYAGPADIPKFVGILTGSISITSLILSIFGMAIPSDITDIIVESIQIILALILLYFACKVDATGFYSEPFRTGWHIALICGCIGIYIAAMIFCAIL
ncbi:MAG: hypothetical protein HWN65_15625 [Candidatus Helarchaeota archaeon]|nr:hypothetical protein [Candidatus Helarchaeota archaeon]